MLYTHKCKCMAGHGRWWPGALERHRRAHMHAHVAQVWDTYTGEDLFTLEGHKNVVSVRVRVWCSPHMLHACPVAPTALRAKEECAGACARGCGAGAGRSMQQGAQTCAPLGAALQRP